ncbi:hypothetical protein [Mucilaginibacter pocheonensis]|uniref:Uncharacterized protein n=1 Tax=Mucilaginibacter pocheonensis TaxID=398050 RepID=A0ABU1TFX8_9SPHI|nr:hypothetical protein [Mucilaginibacter pocheonensis]MDR6944156.1 hypothetical protein [Mucilaginibacter pocheonensis]
MKTIVRYTLLMLLFINTAWGQSNTLNGVYAGIEITPSTVMGGGMGRDDISFLFRPDGSFCDELHKPDWTTRVSGHYTVTGKTINLKYNTGTRTLHYKLENDGNIDAGGYYLLHQPADSSIPPGYYQFSKINGSGGGNSGMTYVGVGSDNSLNFDGKGNFSNSRASATAVIGEGVGGGNSRKSSGKGTYKINKGTLTLNFDDGRTELHSFFCRPGDKPIMAVIDGNIFFMEDKQEQKGQSTSGNAERSSSTSMGANSSTGTTENATISDAKTMLLKANAVQGGTALDNLKVLSFTATMQGLQVSSHIDLPGKRVRLEIWKNGKLIQVEQLEGETGWIWQNGKVTPLPPIRSSEMGSVFHSGLLGLRRTEIDALTIKNVKQTSSGNVITAVKNGKQFIFMLNDQSQLVAAADNTGRVPSTSVYSNLRVIDGVLLPFQEIATSGQQRNLIRYQKFEVNPSLPEITWNKP